MQRFAAHTLCQFMRDLEGFRRDAAAAQGVVTPMDIKTLEPTLTLCAQAHEFFYLPATAAWSERIKRDLSVPCGYPRLRERLEVLSQIMEDELGAKLMLFMPAKRAVYFLAGENLLGSTVLRSFPQLAGDIDEAGKCLGGGRFTAAVFHLMRVMETGVQEFGKTLGVELAGEMVWQKILNQVNSEISERDHKDPKTVTLASTSANLYAVKLAWRNEVMHPKATYTEDEATRVMEATKAYMTDLVAVCIDAMAS